MIDKRINKNPRASFDGITEKWKAVRTGDVVVVWLDSLYHSEDYDTTIVNTNVTINQINSQKWEITTLAAGFIKLEVIVQDKPKTKTFRSNSLLLVVKD